MPQWRNIRPIVVNTVMTKETFSPRLTTFTRRCAWSWCGIWYIHPGLWRKLIRTWLYFTPPPHLAGCNVVVICELELARFQTNILEALTSPTEASSRCMWIGVHWPSLEYGQHSPEPVWVYYPHQERIQWELTPGSLTTLSPNIDEWWAITWQDFTTCRLGSTQGIIVWLQSVHLDGYPWASELIIQP